MIVFFMSVVIPSERDCCLWRKGKQGDVTKMRSLRKSEVKPEGGKLQLCVGEEAEVESQLKTSFRN